MKLPKEEVLKIANLARIELSDQEIKKYSTELGRVLSYVEQLDELDTENVEPIAHISGITAELRDDAVEGCENSAQLIEMAPDHTEDQVKTKKVL
ncbi:Asp-tRNA(Asn)/Glu-tRNA(Gln) amidotransferase subunit GatC [Patescibacteria group bacterium]